MTATAFLRQDGTLDLGAIRADARERARRERVTGGLRERRDRLRASILARHPPTDLTPAQADFLAEEWRKAHIVLGALPASCRRFVFARYGGRCQACGTTDRLQVDHIVPAALGGDDHPDNLWPLCQRCNREKGTLLLEEWLARLTRQCDGRRSGAA